MINIQHSEKKRFVLKYTLRAMLSFAIIFAGILLFKELYFDHNPDYWINKFYGNSLIIYLIYVVSEVFFGIFPPELFMFWAIKAGGTASYILNILFFALVSMGAGHLAYWGGRFLAKRMGKRIEKLKFVSEHLPTVKRFGGVLIILAALTPLPWATISLVMGTVGYSYRSYSLFALARIFRFALNGFLIFQSGVLFF